MIDRRRVLFAIVVSTFVAAPTVGDIGSCGAPVQPLDATRFFDQRLRLTCAHCQSCGLGTAACTIACDPATPRPTDFPTGCHPVVHDGDVCLNALDALSCSAFADFVSSSPIVPTECDFCPASHVGGGL